MQNTIEFLKTKAWYRFLKVVYVTVFLLVMFIVNSFWFVEGFSETFGFLLGDAIAIFIFYLIRGAFYYIAIGKFNPKK
ncbi:hypothetical protein KKF38_01390 [Patescibacteria group bacterium]|nr:hypothetical protein [Patescibacteria group bacterium]